MRKRANNRRNFAGVLSATLCSLALLLMGRCASTDSVSAGSNEAANATVLMEPPPASPSLSRLLERLRALGYDGVGLEFESESTLEFLGKVFQSPRVANRRIKLMYTGLALSFDPKHDSLTIGGTADVEAVLKYVEKNIPLKLSAPIK